jgi:hypothetical protein
MQAALPLLQLLLLLLLTQTLDAQHPPLCSWTLPHPATLLLVLPAQTLLLLLQLLL